MRLYIYRISVCAEKVGDLSHCSSDTYAAKEYKMKNRNIVLLFVTTSVQVPSSTHSYEQFEYFLTTLSVLIIPPKTQCRCPKFITMFYVMLLLHRRLHQSVVATTKLFTTRCWTAIQVRFCPKSLLKELYIFLSFDLTLRSRPPPVPLPTAILQSYGTTCCYYCHSDCSYHPRHRHRTMCSPSAREIRRPRGNWIWNRGNNDFSIMSRSAKG